MKIALVVGHAKDKQGAWGNAGLSEYEYWSVFAQDLKERLEDAYPEHTYKIFKRPTNKRGYGSRMAALHSKLDSWGSNLSVSLHFNAASDYYVEGHEVLYCSKSGRYYANLLNNSFNKYLVNRDRGIKKKGRKDRGGGFLCRGRSVCILSEPYFASQQVKYDFGTQGYEDLINSFMDFVASI